MFETPWENVIARARLAGHYKIRGEASYPGEVGAEFEKKLVELMDTYQVRRIEAELEACRSSPGDMVIYLGRNLQET